MSDWVDIIESNFKKCVVIKHNERGTIINCKLGLWMVDAPTEERALDEARHYWIQYYKDGEYDKLLTKQEEPK